MKEEVFVCIDCETTGLDPQNDSIIEVAVATFGMEGLFDQFESLVDPKRDIPAETIKIHNITPDMVQGKPTIDQVLPQVLELVGDHIIMGHGVGFDIEILIAEAKRHNIPCTIGENTVIDTLRMARLYGESRTNSLAELRNHFNIHDEGAHRAMSDVVVNIDVFRQLAKDYKTTKALLEVLSRPIKLKAMPLGKHKGRPMRDVPLDYLIWAANKNFDQDLLYSIRSEISRRKKGSSFSQASNPFSNL